MKKTISLKYRIAATIFLLEAAMMALVLSQTLSLSVQGSRSQQIAHETATLNSAAEISRNALLTEEYDDLLSYISTVPQINGVVHVLVADQNNKVIASTRFNELGKPMPKLENTAVDLWRVSKIQNDNESLGTLAIKFSNEKLFESISKARNLGISIALSGMVIIGIIGLLMGYVLTRRLEILSKSVTQFANGDLSVKTELRGNDEVAEVGQAFNIMAEKIREHIKELENSSKRFALAVNGSNDGIWDWDIANGQVYYSQRYKDILGFKKNDKAFTGDIHDWRGRIYPDDYVATIKSLEDYLEGKNKSFMSEHRLKNKAGEYLWVMVRGKALRDDDGIAIRMSGSLTDISERKRQEVTIRHQAYHDAMTDLPNRIVLQDSLKNLISASRSKNSKFAVLMMDLNRFKEINDTLGHQIGDAVIKEVASRLKSSLRSTDTISRFGGDEFTILLDEVDEEKSVLVVNKILESLRPIFTIDNHSLHIEASIGITVFPQHGTDEVTLLKHADVAMYAAKYSHQPFSVYNPKENANSTNRLMMTSELSTAIENNQLVLHYQPKIDLQSAYPCGVEALVRWQHPKSGLLYPRDFIKIAERCGLIKALTDWVIDSAIQQRHVWQQQGIALPISVNLSVHNLQDQNFAQTIQNKLQTLNVSPACIELEITESDVMTNPARALTTLKQLYNMGIKLSIDDFGTGYSSLSYLQKLPVHTIKIDKSFIFELSNKNNNNYPIVQSMIELGHNLKLKVIAEGVENQQIIEVLKSLNCDEAQGFHVCRPLPLSEFSDWMQTNLQLATPKSGTK